MPASRDHSEPNRPGRHGPGIALAAALAIVALVVWALAGDPDRSTTHDPAASTDVVLRGSASLAVAPTISPTPPASSTATVEQRIRTVAGMAAALVESAAPGRPGTSATCGRLRTAAGQPVRRFVWIDAARLLATDTGSADFATLAERACLAGSGTR